ncbi:tryptophan halogenase family protein [Sphingomonas sp. FW199]|uniref:tryptophan halogenase family protein n=1 Tax=Sphingomonas sp. FW199 TaxID=3400217 RepID=UPI003CEA09E4
MTDRSPARTRVVIAGGGTAGWCAAAALSKQLGALIDITLVESDEIGTVGVGEATIPTVRSFHTLCGIDEREFMAATQATFKLGIAFENWAQPGDRYLHSFGVVGKSTWMADFQHIWLEARRQGIAGPIGDYCFEHQAADAEKFYVSDAAKISYAFHLDATAYARFLRSISERQGVRRVEGRIARVEQHGETGDIAALHLENGTMIAGDLFIDCTGFRSLLLGQTLGVPYVDWSEWLPMNAAQAVQTEAVRPAVPYTRAIAHDAGWRWQIPLQTRVGNGLVYSTDYLSDDAARDRLLGAIEGRPLTDPRQLRFTTGRRARLWERNVVAMGLSSGFLEPLESTSIHLMMIAVTRLIQMFPFGTGSHQALADRFNAISIAELEGVRDFIILHYAATQRDDSPFWQRCRSMTLPDSLRARMTLWRESAQAFQAGEDIFRVDSWIQVMLGQRVEPQDWHAVARMIPPPRLAESLRDLKQQIDRAVGQMPHHADFVAGYCPARAA